MLALDNFDNIYFFRPVVDFRKGIVGLCRVIQEEMLLSPFDNYLFLFCNRTKERIKAIYWDQTGFVMWYKILEQEKYSWPIHLEDDVLLVNLKNLETFLRGLNPWEVPHQKLEYEMI